MIRSGYLLIFAIVVAVVLGMQGVSRAIPTLTLDGITITDGGVGDSNPLAGWVTFIGTVGGFSVNVTTGLTSGSPTLAHLDLSTLSTFSGPGTLTIQFGDTGFSGPISGTFDVGGTLSGSAGSSVLFDSFYNSTLLATLGPFSLGAFSGSTGFSASPASPYSLMIEAIITMTGPGQVSFNEEFQAVPEPISLILLGSGLVGAGVYRRLRKEKKA